jgi:hypothetical protein
MNDEDVDTALPEVVAWVAQQTNNPVSELVCERFTAYCANLRDTIASRFAPRGWDAYYDYEAYAFGQMNRDRVCLVVRENGELVMIRISNAHLFERGKVDRFVVYSNTKTTLCE